MSQAAFLHDSGEYRMHWRRLTLAAAILLLVACLGVMPTYFWPSGRLFGQPNWPHNALRAAFVATASILPMFLFYLHAMIRRESAFNSFVTALYRLGLLCVDTRGGAEQRAEAQRRWDIRLRGYADRFAAAYGARPADVSALLLRIVNPDAAPVAVHDSLRGDVFQLRSLLAPAGVSLLAFLGWLLTLPPLPRPVVPAADDLGHILSPLLPEMSATVAAFLGAYLFSIEMLRRRFVLRDLNVNLYVSIMVRLVFSVALAAVLASSAAALKARWSLTDQDLIVLAFLIGGMPMVFVHILLIYIAGFIPALQLSRGDLPLRIMDGIDIWHEARLDEEDIQDVENLACANLVNLIISTRYSADRLVDWVDQAILYTAIGPQPDDKPSRRSWFPSLRGKPDAAAPPPAAPLGLRALLRSYGIRTATDLVRILTHGSEAGAASPMFPEGLAPDLRIKVGTLAAAIDNHPNFPLVREWRTQK